MFQSSPTPSPSPHTTPSPPIVSPPVGPSPPAISPQFGVVNGGASSADSALADAPQPALSQRSSVGSISPPSPRPRASSNDTRLSDSGSVSGSISPETITL